MMIAMVLAKADEGRDDGGSDDRQAHEPVPERRGRGEAAAQAMTRGSLFGEFSVMGRARDLSERIPDELISTP